MSTRYLGKMDEVSYQCAQCDQVLVGREALDTHMKEHNKDKVKCDVCGRYYDDIQKLKRHRLVAHGRGDIGNTGLAAEGSPNQHRCRECKKIFASQGDLKRHRIVKHAQLEREPQSVHNIPSEMEPLLDIHCEEQPVPNSIMIDVRTLEGHLQSPPSQAKIGNMATKSGVKTNVAKKKVSAKQSTVKCKICGKGFLNLHRMRIHQSIQHKKHNLPSHVTKHQQKKHTCEYCNKECKTLPALKYHKTVMHGKHLECNICHDFFKNENDLDDHTEEKHSDGDLECEGCGVTFTEMYQLMEHKKTHAKCKPARQSTMTKSIVEMLDDLNGGASSVESNTSGNETGDICVDGNGFLCKVCGVQNSSLLSMSKHMSEKHPYTIHNDKQDRTCQTCKIVFSDTTSLQRHIKNKSCRLQYIDNHKSNQSKTQQSDKIYTCHRCDHTFTKKSLMKKHKLSKVCQKAKKQNHDKVKAYQCTKCMVGFSTSWQLRVHNTVGNCSLKSNYREYTCQKCFITFCKKGGLTRHLQTKICSMTSRGQLYMPGAFSCNQCAHRFFRMKQYTLHKRQVHGLKKSKTINNIASKVHKDSKSELKFKEYTCPLCNTTFTQNPKLQAHLRHKRCKFDSGMQCDLCPNKYRSRAYLQMHKKNVHKKIKTGKTAVNMTNKNIEPAKSRYSPNKVYNFPCKKCSEKFTTWSLWRSHVLNTHEKGLWPTCPLCNRSFTRYFTVVRHIKSKHKPHPPYHCCVCSQLFPTTDAVYRHEKRFHKDDEIQCCKHIYKIKDCDARLPKKLMQKHALLHVDEPNYRCQKCGSGFKKKENYEKHFKVGVLCHLNVKSVGPKKSKPTKDNSDTKSGHEEKKPFVCKQDNCNGRFRAAHLREAHKVWHRECAVKLQHMLETVNEGGDNVHIYC